METGSWRAQYAWFRVVDWMVNTLPGPAAVALADRMADVQWRCSAKDRDAVAANLAGVLGTPVPSDSPLVREVFRNFGRYVVEFFASRRTARAHVAVEGQHHLEEAHRRAPGVMLLTAHLGNWELGAATIRRLGFPIAAVALPHQDPRLDRLFNRQRERSGVRVIPLGVGATRHSLQCLRAGQMLGLLCDRSFTAHGTPVTLCGRATTFPSGPALISLRSRAPAVSVFLVREAPWSFRFYIEPPIWPDADSGPSAVEALTQQYANVVARYVKRFPTQWLMFQPVWG